MTIHHHHRIPLFSSWHFLTKSQCSPLLNWPSPLHPWHTHCHYSPLLLLDVERMTDLKFLLCMSSWIWSGRDLTQPASLHAAVCSCATSFVEGLSSFGPPTSLLLAPTLRLCWPTHATQLCAPGSSFIFASSPSSASSIFFICSSLLISFVRVFPPLILSSSSLVLCCRTASCFLYVRVCLFLTGDMEICVHGGPFTARLF